MNHEWDHIVDVYREFLRFANDMAAEISQTRVLGTTLWDHLHGTQVVALHRMLITAVRAAGGSCGCRCGCDCHPR